MTKSTSENVETLKWMWRTLDGDSYLASLVNRTFSNDENLTPGTKSERRLESGDETVLIQRIKDGCELTLKERTHIAGRLDGSIKRRQGRRRDEQLFARTIIAVSLLRFLMDEGNQRDHAKDMAAKELGVSRTTLDNFVRRSDNWKRGMDLDALAHQIAYIKSIK